MIVFGEIISGSLRSGALLRPESSGHASTESTANGDGPGSAIGAPESAQNVAYLLAPEHIRLTNYNRMLKRPADNSRLHGMPFGRCRLGAQAAAEKKVPIYDVDEALQACASHRGWE